MINTRSPTETDVAIERERERVCEDGRASERRRRRLAFDQSYRVVDAARNEGLKRRASRFLRLSLSRRSLSLHAHIVLLYSAQLTQRQVR